MFLIDNEKDNFEQGQIFPDEIFHDDVFPDHVFRVFFFAEKEIKIVKNSGSFNLDT